MEKALKINNKEYRLHSSLFTIIDYKNVFATELFNDVKKLDDPKLNKDEELSTVIEGIFKIIYVLHRPFTKKSYTEFLRSLDFSVLTNQVELEELTKTIGEMLSTFHRDNSNNKAP